jgi:hypothetical protein
MFQYRFDFLILIIDTEYFRKYGEAASQATYAAATKLP